MNGKDQPKVIFKDASRYDTFASVIHDDRMETSVVDIKTGKVFKLTQKIISKDDKENL